MSFKIECHSKYLAGKCRCGFVNFIIILASIHNFCCNFWLKKTKLVNLNTQWQPCTFPGTKVTPPPGEGGGGRAHGDLHRPAGLQCGVHVGSGGMEIHREITAAGRGQKSKSVKHKSTLWL